MFKNIYTYYEHDVMKVNFIFKINFNHLSTNIGSLSRIIFYLTTSGPGRSRLLGLSKSSYNFFRVLIYSIGNKCFTNFNQQIKI